jgi:hypothetical protein
MTLDELLNKPAILLIHENDSEPVSWHLKGAGHVELQRPRGSSKMPQNPDGVRMPLIAEGDSEVLIYPNGTVEIYGSVGAQTAKFHRFRAVVLRSATMEDLK